MPSRREWRVGAQHLQGIHSRADLAFQFQPRRGIGIACGIKNVGIGGFTTDVCVYAAVTNAYDLGYHVYALRDAMAGYFPEQSELMLKNTYPMWSKVISNDDWLAMLERGEATR